MEEKTILLPYDWAIIRGIISTDEINAIEQIWPGDKDKYLSLMNLNSHIIINDILPGYFHYKKENFYRGYFIHEKYKNNIINKNTVKSSKYFKFFIGGNDGTTDVYLGMPASDIEIKKEESSLSYIPEMYGKHSKGVCIHNNTGTGITIKALVDLENKIYAFVLS